MAKYWKKDGKYIKGDDGAYCKADDCPCVEEECDFCTVAPPPASLDLEFELIADGSCTACDPGHNATTYTLDFEGTENSKCYWRGSGGACGETFEARFEQTLPGEGWMVVTVFQGANVVAEYFSATFVGTTDCEATRECLTDGVGHGGLCVWNTPGAKAIINP